MEGGGDRVIQAADPPGLHRPPVQGAVFQIDSFF